MENISFHNYYFLLEAYYIKYKIIYEYFIISK
jgi:hypothetical protein